MHGDRYWYSNSGAFSLPQLRAITGSTTLAQVICRFLGKDSHVQPKAFMVSDDYSNFPALCNSTGRDENFLVEWKDEYIEYPMPDDDIKRLLEKAENVVKHRKSASSNSRQASTRASYTDPFQIYAHMMRPKEGAVKLSGASDVLLEYSHMIMQFGQFIGHEITHAPLDRGPGNEALNCTSCDSFDTVSPSCLPIPIPGNDPFFAPFHDGSPRCLAFVRSLNGQRQLGPRRQINQVELGMPKITPTLFHF
ncbi:unnamed protein product [Heligmosomoides polygyrus]|uniref:Uncharacterized protein n=1 Tax=Heligmosomoides polygyrus TaxID=6339 RepID=A0A3P7ZNT2_HELPZ|nr:unnamed protein product [Heligmosomoides polygyrus]